MAPPVPRTKKGKTAQAKKVMGEFKRGTLHSGSKAGPVVTKRKQAIAIMLKQTGQSDSTRVKAKAVGGKKRARPKKKKAA